MPFLRPLRSKDNRCWILRLQSRNFVIISESLAANLKYGRPLYYKRFQSSDWYVFSIAPQRLSLVSNAKRKISKSNKSELWNRLSYRGLPYFFEITSQTFRNDYKIWWSQHQNSTRLSLDLNGLKNSPSLHFKNSLKSMHLFQRLMGVMNCTGCFNSICPKTNTY